MGNIKTGLVLEGGSMRGMFTCGIIDVFMENGIEFDGLVGTSAGAAFGFNYKTHQIGRGVRYNKRFCRDKRYASVRSLITTGDIYNVDFAYYKLCDELDPADWEAFKKNPMEFYACCTDMDTGKAIYHLCDKGREDLEWVRGSASMPLLSKIFEVDGYKLSDGGTADSIPLQFFESIGYNRNVVVLTQAYDYVKKPIKVLPLMKLVYRKYPAFVEALYTRYKRYNACTDYIKEQEKLGNILVIKPDEKLGIAPVCHDPDELERVYQIGREMGYRRLEEVKRFIAKS